MDNGEKGEERREENERNEKGMWRETRRGKGKVTERNRGYSKGAVKERKDDGRGKVKGRKDKEMTKLEDITCRRSDLPVEENEQIISVIFKTGCDKSNKKMFRYLREWQKNYLQYW